MKISVEKLHTIIRIKFKMKKYFTKVFRKVKSRLTISCFFGSVSILSYNSFRHRVKSKIFCRFVVMNNNFITVNHPQQKYGANWVNSRKFSAEMLEQKNAPSCTTIVNTRKKRIKYLSFILGWSNGIPITQKLVLICLKMSSNSGIFIIQLSGTYEHKQRHDNNVETEMTVKDFLL